MASPVANLQAFGNSLYLSVRESCLVVYRDRSVPASKAESEGPVVGLAARIVEIISSGIRCSRFRRPGRVCFGSLADLPSQHHFVSALAAKTDISARWAEVL